MNHIENYPKDFAIIFTITKGYLEYAKRSAAQFTGVCQVPSGFGCCGHVRKRRQLSGRSNAAEEGYDVIGVTLQLYDHGAAFAKGACCAGIDIHDARRVASDMNFPHYVLDYENIFKDL